MGNVCCQPWDGMEVRPGLPPTSNLVDSFGDEVCERPGTEKKRASTRDVSKEASDNLSRFVDSSPAIVALQAWCRGILARKAHPRKNLLRPATIIKYVTCQVRGLYKSSAAPDMEPFDVDWNMNEFKGKLELRKLTRDEQGNVYIGYRNIKTGKKEGYGQAIYVTGARYEGMWVDGEYEGRGRYIHENGDCYAGTWKHGKADGFGTFIGVDGMKYTGEWHNDEHHGKGNCA